MVYKHFQFFLCKQRKCFPFSFLSFYTVGFFYLNRLDAHYIPPPTPPTFTLFIFPLSFSPMVAPFCLPLSFCKVKVKRQNGRKEIEREGVEVRVVTTLSTSLKVITYNQTFLKEQFEHNGRQRGDMGGTSTPFNCCFRASNSFVRKLEMKSLRRVPKTNSTLLQLTTLNKTR